MGEGSPALPSEPPSSVVISDRRLLIKMAVLGLTGTVIGSVAADIRFGIGVFFGGLLAFLNYLWLRRSTASIFEKALQGTPARFVAVGYISRYVVIALVVAAVYFSGTLPVSAVIIGLSVFAVAVVAEGIAVLFRRNN